MAKIFPFDREVALKNRLARLADEYMALMEDMDQVPEDLRPALLQQLDAIGRDLDDLTYDVRQSDNPKSKIENRKSKTEGCP